MSNNPKNENIQLSLPVNAAYVSAARLTASSIANRMGFEIDDIEDIKAAVSEACTYVIKKLVNGKSDFKIMFSLKDEELEIVIHIDGKLDQQNDEDEMSLVMLRAFMDHLDISSTSGEDDLTIKMIKRHKFSAYH